ncbi:MAG: stsB [Gemmatimonadetes bacterium]|nr:stsB [Gemmatimonadota bacterium]
MATLTPARLTATLEQRSCDVIVIGAGLSGLSAAHGAFRAQPDSRILVIEAGPLGPRCHVDRLSASDSGFVRWCGEGQDPYIVPPSYQRRNWSGVARRVLGGRGIYWHGVLCKINPLEFAADAAATDWLNRGGFLHGADSYFLVEEQLRSIGAFVPGGEGLPGAARVLPFRTTDRAIRPSGLPFAPLDYFDLTARDPAGVSVLADTSATSLSKRGNVWRVELCRGGQCDYVEAGSVVLASGLLENCRLLETHYRTGQPYSFTDHLDAGVVCAVPSESPAFRPLMTTVGRRYLWDRSSTDGFNLFITCMAHEKRLVVIAWGTGEKDCRSPLVADFSRAVGCVMGERSAVDRQKDAVMSDAAHSALRSLLDAYGERQGIAIQAMVEETKAAVRRFNYDEPNPWSGAPYVSELGSTDHEACLVNSALEFDVNGRAKDDPSLGLAGPAALKRMGSANPNYTALVMALRLGRELAG